MVQQVKWSHKRVIMMTAVLCVTVFFVFASVRALASMNVAASEPVSRSEGYSDFRGVSPGRMYDFIRALESLGLKFD